MVSRQAPSFQPERIVELRERLERATQQELAEKVGCSVRSVQGWEAGREPRAKHLRVLAELAGEPVDWFYNGQVAA